MSRTYKDTPHEVRFPNSNYSLEISKFRGEITKKKRFSKPDWESHYHSTPGWFIHLFMTKPRRRENRVYEAKVKQVPLDLLELFEPFLNWKKPHEYYW